MTNLDLTRFASLSHLILSLKFNLKTFKLKIFKLLKARNVEVWTDRATYQALDMTLTRSKNIYII